MNGVKNCVTLISSKPIIKSKKYDATLILCNATLTWEVWPWVNVMIHSWFISNRRVKYHLILSHLPLKSYCPKTYFAMFALWPSLWGYYIVSRSWHNLSQWTFIQIQLTNEKLWARSKILLHTQCKLYCVDMTFLCVIFLSTHMVPIVNQIRHLGGFF